MVREEKITSDAQKAEAFSKATYVRRLSKKIFLWRRNPITNDARKEVRSSRHRVAVTLVKKSEMAFFAGIGILFAGASIPGFAASEIDSASSVVDSSPSFSSFWAEDVWLDPERPFLFYGEDFVRGKRVRVPAEDPDPGKQSETDTYREKDIRAITSIGELRSEVKHRLEEAVMDPSDAKMASYLEANAFLNEKAGRFAERWSEALMHLPQFDWTAQHPTVNAASTTLSRERSEATVRKLLTLKDDWGLVYFGDSGRLTGLMRPLVDRFAALYGLELVNVAVGGPSKYMSKARLDHGEARRVGGVGLKLFPALVLMHRSDRGLEDGRLVATGVVDIVELGRRVERLVMLHEKRYGKGIAGFTRTTRSEVKAPLEQGSRSEPGLERRTLDLKADEQKLLGVEP